MTVQLVINQNKDKAQFVPADVPKRKRKSRVALAAEAAAKYTPRARHPNEALPPSRTWTEGVYRPGDGDVITPKRIESNYKSRGIQND